MKTRKDLEGLLSKTSDRFSVFTSREELKQYNINLAELIEVIKKYLNSREIANLFTLQHFIDLPSNTKYEILKCISESSVLLEMIRKFETLKMEDLYAEMLIDFLNPSDQIEILHDIEFLRRYKVNTERIIISMPEEEKKLILEDKSFTEELQLNSVSITKIAIGISSEETKTAIIDLYQLDSDKIVTILCTYSDESKVNILIQRVYELENNQIERVLASFEIDALLDFLRTNEDFLKQNGIKPYNITRRLPQDKQMELVEQLANVDLSLDEKRKILATLPQKTKDAIDIDNVSQEYRTALTIRVKNIDDYRICVDFQQDLEIYRGLDELIIINGMRLENKDIPKMMELCDICPQMRIQDNLDMGNYSTTQEYKAGETWIQSLLQSIPTEWTDIQKVAFIDNALGKKVSYSPDFDTEVFSGLDSRALWKIIDSGYGICNGIAQLEAYILGKIGIEVEQVSCKNKNHSFLKLKNIKLPTPEGKTVKGDTILDPTWNLAANQNGARPEYFCRSYKEIRKDDIGEDGRDSECHRNDEQLESATLDLDVSCLRKIYTSIGLADEKGKFLITELMEKAKSIDDKQLPADESIQQQLKALAEYNPSFATCQNSTMRVLKDVSLAQDNLRLDRCVINRVYQQNDQEKCAVLYVYVEIPQVGKKFYYADKETSSFIELSQKEFEEKFECYEQDLEKEEGRRPWEQESNTKSTEDLSASSGKINATEGGPEK